MSEFVKSYRESYLLAHEGHLYHKTGKNKRSWYWICSRTPEGKNRATSIGEPPGSPTVIKTGKHEHAPDQDEINAKKVVNGMKNVAAQPEMPPANIIRAGLAEVGDEVLPRLPERPALKRTINRKRQADLPRNPQTLSEIRQLPEENRKTLSGMECFSF